MELSNDKMEFDVVQLATRAGRMVGTRGHEQARRFLEGRMGELGLVPYGAEFSMPYRAGTTAFANVISVAPGRREDAPPVVLAAHYDTCGPHPGADDNAAAVAIALEVGRRLLERPAARDVIVALFDAEEPPHFMEGTMGSVHWYRHQRRGPVHGALVLDLVGHDLAVPGLEDLLFVMGMETDPELQGIVDSTTPGLRIQPLLNRYVGPLSDHYVFEQHQRPYLFLSCGRWEHYHRPTDTPDNLSWPKIHAVADYTEQAVRGMCESSLDAGYNAYDTTAPEAAAFRRNFAATMPYASGVKTRAQINTLVRGAMTLFGL